MIAYILQLHCISTSVVLWPAVPLPLALQTILHSPAFNHTLANNFFAIILLLTLNLCIVYINNAFGELCACRLPYYHLSLMFTLPILSAFRSIIHSATASVLLLFCLHVFVLCMFHIFLAVLVNFSTVYSRLAGKLLTLLYVITLLNLTERL